MILMARWFGSSGIRGSFDKISPNFSLTLGIAVGRALKSSKPAFIASDIRATSDILKSSFMSGFSSVSGTIINIGLCPTPVISYISSSRKNTLGIMITASHNPPSNNGFKFFFNGGECGEDFEAKVENFLQDELNRNNKDKMLLQSWKNVGISKYDKVNSYISAYTRYILSKIEIKHQDRKIILDCANNVPNLVSPQVLNRFGFEVSTINETLDASFPGRPSEPTSENLTVLKKRVIEENADIGIAHDGDGDRFALIDERGNFIHSTTIINFFLNHLNYLDPDKRKIILTSDCTSQAVEIAENNGAETIISRIGRNREFVNDRKILFLAEPNKLLFPEFGKWIDGLYPVLKFLKLSDSGEISKILEPFSKQKILRKAFNVRDEDKKQVKNIIYSLPDLWSKRISNISSIDGIKLFFSDKSRLLIRFSGTEPKIKFYIESNSEKKNRDILSGLKNIFNLHTIGIDC